MKDKAMKNSARIPSKIQADAKKALQRQAQQILPALTSVFSDLNYSEISHQRLSQQSNGSGTDYHGLTRAQHLQFESVMIKWQLSGLSKDANKNLANLNYEADILKSINSISSNQNSLQNSLSAIAPAILAYKSLTVQMLAQSQQLTILVIPYYPDGSLATQLNSQKYLSLTAQKKHYFIMKSAYLIANLHNVGWLHNDIKPSNILLTDFSTVSDNGSIIPNLLLTDFALAKPINSSVEAIITGTPAYLAPERWQGQSATVQSDIYAFGIMMTEILTGERQFNIDPRNDEPLKEWAIQHCQQPIAKLSLEYSRYQYIIDKALAKQVERRYQNMQDVLRDLTLLKYR